MSWTIISKPENQFQVVESLTHIYLTEKGVTEDQIISGEVKPYLAARIDAHDSRIIAVVQSANLPADMAKRQKAAAELTAYLETYKGKCTILCNSKHQDLFKNCEFAFTPEDPCKRMVETTPAGLRGTLESKETGKYFIKHIEHPEKYFDQIITLMKKSGFLESKIKEYIDKGTNGIQVMFKNARTQCLFDRSGKLVGLCRDSFQGVNDAGEKIGYLGDTLIDPEAFMTEKEKQNKTSEEVIAAARARGTQELYKQASYAFDYNRIQLIAPPKREKEFEDNFGFKKPIVSETNSMVTLYRFGPATSKYQEKLQQHLTAIQKASIKKHIIMGVIGIGGAIALGGLSLFSRSKSSAAAVVTGLTSTVRPR